MQVWQLIVKAYFEENIATYHDFIEWCAIKDVPLTEQLDAWLSNTQSIQDYEENINRLNAITCSCTVFKA